MKLRYSNEGEKKEPSSPNNASKERRKIFSGWKEAFVGVTSAALFIVAGCRFDKGGVSINPVDGGNRDVALLDVNNHNDSGTDAGIDVNVPDARPDVTQLPEASVLDATVDSSIIDAEADSDIPDSSLTDAEIPDADQEDSGVVVCNGTYDATNVTVVIWRNNAREVGGMCFRYMDFNTDDPPLVTMDVECNGDANCNNTVKAKTGIVLEEGTPYPDVISNTAVNILYNTLLSNGDRVNVTISVAP